MKTKKIVLGAFLLMSSVLISFSVIKKSDKSHKSKAKNYTAVKQYVHPVSASDAQNFRSAYKAANFVMADDVGAYMFLHLSEVMPTAVISRSGDVANFEYDLQPALANVRAKSVLGNLTLQEMMEHEAASFRGIVVVKNGEIVFEEYPGMRENDNHIWASSSKTITGLLVHMLEEEGRIDLDKKVSDYIAEYKNTEWDQVTVLDVMNHTSGLDFVESASTLSDPGSLAARAFASALAGRGEPTGESIFNLLKNAELIDKPGTKFDYSTFNTQVLGIIIERVTGLTLPELMTERIWAKAGMEGDAQVALTSSGEVLNGGIFSSRLRDFARYATLFTPSWEKVANEQIVSDSYFEKVMTRGNTAAYGTGEKSKRDIETFGEPQSHKFATYQWDVVFKDGDLYKAGRNGQALYVSPEKDVAVVWFSTRYNNDPWLAAYARALAQELAD